MIDDDILRTTMMVGVSGSLMTSGLLLTNHFIGKRACKWMSCLLLVPLLAAICWCVFWRYEFRSWWPLTVFVAGFSVGGMGCMPDFERRLARILSPNLVWAGLLAACVVSANIAALAFANPAQTQSGVNSRYVNYRLSDKPLTVHNGFTDAGRRISLYEYDVQGDDAEDVAYKLKVLDLTIADQYRHSIIRLTDPDSHVNCHGYVFSDNRFSLDDTAVEAILVDNGYCPVVEPQPGDVVIYRGPDNVASHSGIVRDSRGTVLVESKWGPLGVYLHRVELSPFGGEYGYFSKGSPSHSIRFATVEAVE